MDQKLYDLLKRIQEGEKFFRPADDGDEANIAFKSEANRLRELQQLDYIRLSDKGFVKNHTNGKGFYNTVGPCEITYKGEQILDAGETIVPTNNSQTAILQNANLSTMATPPSQQISNEESIPHPALQILKRRLNDVSNNITQDFELLKKYEDALRFEDNPRRQANYENEIEKLKTSALTYANEYESLENQMSGGSAFQSQSVSSEISSVHEKLDALLIGQINIHQHLGSLGQTILNHYDAGEQKILNSILEKITETQAQTVEAILEASEKNQLDETEMNATINAVQQALIRIEEKGENVIPEQQKLVEAVNAPQFNVKHKLKMTIPIVPFLMNYETELELGTGANLEGVWNKLANKFSGK